MSQKESEYPNWENMPKPKPILTLSWEDIYEYAKENDTELTREQVIKAFEFAEHNSSNECIMGAFNANLEYAIDQVKK